MGVVLVGSSICGVWALRIGVVRRVLRLVSEGLSVCVTGGKGVGKTVLLKHLEFYLDDAVYVSSKSLKPLLEEVVGGSGTVFELKQRVLRSGKVLLVDGLGRARRAVRDAVTFFIREGVTVVGASRDKLSVLFDVCVELDDLSRLEAERFAEYLGADPGAARKVSMVSRNPERVELLVKRSLVGEEVRVDEPKHFNWKLVFSFATLCLCLRYVFYGLREYKVGYAFATIAYLLMFLRRVKN